MRRAWNREWIRVLLVVGLIGVIAVGGFGVYLLSVAGDLPWQVDPTRIPITPFADAPEVTRSRVILATPTPP